jgi:hypothetical protein
MGKRNPFYGKTHTEEAKRRIHLFVKGGSSPMAGKHHSLESNIQNSIKHQKGPVIRPLHFGKNLKNAVRCSKKYIQWRQSVFVKASFTCQNSKCGRKGGYLEAHHRFSFAKLIKEALASMPLSNPYKACLAYAPLWDINNGVTLCLKCHRRGKGTHKAQTEIK